jgi:long-chain acyl-CoA synthetase
MIQVQRLFEIPFYQLEHYPSDKMFATKTNGEWIGTSTKTFCSLVNSLSKGLIKHGIEVGDKVAIVSTNRVEWNAMDIAIQQIGAIVVPIYPNISTNDYRYIFNDAAIKLCCVGTKDLFEKLTSIRNEVPSLKHLYCFDEDSETMHWKLILRDIEEISQEEIDVRKDKIQKMDLATIIYTSGTTGNPKGVMLSHNNIISNVSGCLPSIPSDYRDNVLSFLPACHIYERMILYAYMYCGSHIHYAESMETIGDNIRETNPVMFTAVPRLIEKVFDKIMAKGEDLTGIKRKLFFWALSLAEEFELEGKSSWYNFKLKIARKLIFSKWHEALGGKVKAIASGSAALQPRLARIFMAANIPILEGYGLTETSPVITINSFERGVRFGTVGTLIEDVQVKIAEDGEILVKGPNVMMGYYNLPDKTAEEIDSDGWFHTGDIGEMKDGFLKITDRKKEIFKTSGGKYVAPQAMENRFKESRFIEQIMVIGEYQKFPAAFIVPNFPAVTEWAKKNNVDIGKGSNQEISNSDNVKELIQKEVDRFNAEYGNWEQIKKFHLMDHEFGIETGELTPTLKFKRKVILAKYDSIFQSIYCD